MVPDPTLTLADQIFRMIDLFCKTIGPEAHRLRTGILSCAIWNRMRRFERRFYALYAKWKAGKILPPRALRMGGAAARKPVAGAAAIPLPRAPGWLYKLLPQTAGLLAGFTDSLVRNHPEMRQFIAEVPRVGRLLRPIYWMAGIRPPAHLALPKRVRKKKVTSPQSSPQTGDGAARRPRRRTPREVAAAAIERSLRTGKPVDPKKIGAVAYGYVLHWPRDDNCPPPEIGYGGRSFTPLPKDYVRPKDWE